MMEAVGAVTGAKQGIVRKTTMPTMDLWAAVRNGTPHDVDAALAIVKRSNLNIDARNSFGSTALHIAVWRNHVPIVKRLLEAGADVDIRDVESGWSSLHRALHFGHLAVAGVLIEGGASLTLEDFKGRTPVDLLSGPVKHVIGDSNNAGGTEVFSWGNGANYQLGTGTAGIQKSPCRVDVLQGLHVTTTAAAKFHSVALTADGKLYSWGFGRGGRLGHSDFHIHSGQVAVITPQLVSCGLANCRVKFIAVAKHHTVVATDRGEVFTWGSNREGQLGYTSVDTQSTPRRVTSLRARVVAIAAANKHTAVLSDTGDIYTWGCNRDGQLGYGTSNSASNYIPRAIESLKGKNFLAVSAAKYHTVVLGVEGEVFTWGYKMVMPKRVLIARNTRKGGSMPLKFHQAERLHIVSVAAGTTHSTALSEDGLVFYWGSADPHLRCHQLLSMSGHHAVGVAAGKYRTAVVTELGDIYTWDGEKMKIDMVPIPFRIQGAKQAIHVSVGEHHSLVVSAVYIPRFPIQSGVQFCPPIERSPRDVEDCEEDLDMDDMIFESMTTTRSYVETVNQADDTPSLKDLCEKVMAQCIVEPKNALQLLEVADSLGALNLRKHCEDLVLHNLDYLLTISPLAFAHVSSVLLAELEKSLDASSSQPWSNRRLPTPTAVFPAVVDSEEDDSQANHVSRIHTLSVTESNGSVVDMRKASEGIFQQKNEIDQASIKHMRALRKKLQQIEALELKQARGHSLDDQQLSKLQRKQAIKDTIFALEFGASPVPHKNEEKVEMSANTLEEITQRKAVHSRRARNSRRKDSKNPLDQTSSEEFENRKSRNNRVNKGSCKKVETVSNDQKKHLVKDVLSQVLEQKVQDHKRGLATFPSGARDSEIVCPVKIKSIGELIKSDTKDDNHGFVTPSISGSPSNSSPVQMAEHSNKKKSKKGGLSMFLSGALDNVPTPPVQAPVMPKIDGPAWGGVQRNRGLASLREIQSQQTVEASNFTAEESLVSPQLQRSVRAKEVLADGTKRRFQGDTSEAKHDDPDNNACRVPLSQFMRCSAPIAVTPGKASKGAPIVNPDNSPPPWAGTSPLASASSFKEIQMEQVKHKTHQRHGGTQGSPKPFSPVTSVNFSVTSNSVDRGSGDISTSRWYKPETDSPSSIRCIQIEEEAMKELRRIYKNVKLVKTDDS